MPPAASRMENGCCVENSDLPHNRTGTMAKSRMMKHWTKPLGGELSWCRPATWEICHGGGSSKTHPKTGCHHGVSSGRGGGVKVQPHSDLVPRQCERGEQLPGFEKDVVLKLLQLVMTKVSFHLQRPWKIAWMVRRCCAFSSARVGRHRLKTTS